MRRTLIAPAAMALSLIGAGAQAATNLVQDGGFELTTTTPWTVVRWTVDAGPSHSGQGVAGGGCVGAACMDRNGEGAASLSQVIGGLTVGQVYTLSFFFTPTEAEGGGTTTPNALEVYWGDMAVAGLYDVATADYAFYTFEVTATAVAQTLQFLGRNDPGYQLLDDVSLVAREAPGGVPEPASWALMILGFGAAGAALRRRPVLA